MTGYDANVLSPKRAWFQVVADTIGGLAGWRVDVDPTLPRKCVVIAAPHTSNWDLIAGFLMMVSAPIKLYWLGKDSLFSFPPMGAFLKAVGGIPIDRRRHTNFVTQMAGHFAEADVLRFAIAPMGTRKKTDHWKTGFYHIAMAANVPLVFGYFDHENRVVGLSKGFMPTGDIEADFERIREFYADMRGKYPENQSDIRVKPRK